MHLVNSFDNVLKVSLSQKILLFSLGAYSSKVNEDTFGAIIPTGNGRPSGMDRSTEAMLFEGTDGVMEYKNSYFNEFGCSFRLQHYPFDIQVNKLFSNILRSKDS